MLNIDSEKLTIIVPVYNEEDVIATFHSRISAILDKLPCCSEIIYVNDGSSDNSLDALNAIHESDPRAAVLDLSRNFGKEIAMTAGLHRAGDSAVVIIDADLQDPPELIHDFVEKWQDGYDVVYAQRTERAGESWLKKFTANSFYSLMQRVGRVRLPHNVGDYRLLSRRAVAALNEYGEHTRFMKGLFALIGFRQIAIPFQREARHAGETKWNYWQLWNLAIEGITSFTTAPLQIASYLGFLVATVAFIYGVIIVGKTLLYGDPVAGYPSLVTIVLFLGGVQLLAIGTLGEYIGRIFIETKQRPLYFINEYKPSREHRD